jgi:tetratricopeptide (TPR) repeat protein
MILRCLLLLGMVCLAYLPAGRGDFIWDDDEYVVNNQTLRNLPGLEQIWWQPRSTPQYYPLVFSTFWVEYHLWGLEPVGYHWVNIILHGLNSGLLFLVLRRLGVPGAWLAGAIFALHPVHVESVAWITERKNVLSGLFYLSSFLAFTRFSAPEPDQKAGGWSWYVLALVMYVAALLSKTVTCSLPAVLVLVWWWKRGRLEQRELLALAPMFVVGLVLALNTVRLEKHQVGALGEDWNFTPVERCLIAGRALWFYADKLIWPHPLIFNYPRWHIDASQPWQYFFPGAAVLVLAILFLARNRLGKGPLAACLIFAGTLMPALGFFDVYPMIFSFVADHFQYLASAALIALGMATLVSLGQRGGKVVRYLGSIGAVGLLLTLGTLTWKQCWVYQNLETLWDDTLAKNPDSWLAHYNRGTKWMREGEQKNQPTTFPLALRHFQRVLQIKPDHAGAYNQWGSILAYQEQYDQALEKMEKARQLAPQDASIHYNLGLVRVMQKKYEEALPFFEEALRLEPHSSEAHFQVGFSLLRLGRSGEALPHLQKAVEMRPTVASYQEALAEALGKVGPK